MKYSESYNRDFNWYLSVRHKFNFDGNVPMIVDFDPNGKDGKEAFYLFDTKGKLHPTKHPNILNSLIKTKGSVNLHIKMYAQDRAKAILPRFEFDKIIKDIDPPQWFINAVESQKYKYYNI